MLKALFTQVFNESEKAAQEFNATPKSRIPDKKVIAVLLTIALSLTFLKYFGSSKKIIDLAESFSFEQSEKLYDFFKVGANSEINRLSYWAIFSCVCYFALPALVIKWYLKSNLSVFGLTFKSDFKIGKVYLYCISVMIPLVVLVSFSPEFQDKYPFYEFKEGELPNYRFLIWELEYFCQFFALEFFFRGFMLHGIKHRFGFYSVFIMTIPYCMIHFQKPMPETFSSILAGVILGTLSLRSNSIWLGFFLHCTVALTMDLCSLWQKGLLDF